MSVEKPPNITLGNVEYAPAVTLYWQEQEIKRLTEERDKAIDDAARFCRELADLRILLDATTGERDRLRAAFNGEGALLAREIERLRAEEAVTEGKFREAANERDRLRAALELCDGCENCYQHAREALK